MSLVCAAAVLPASAASLGGLDNQAPAAGGAPVGSCGDAFRVDYATTGGNATEVTISGVPHPACDGGALRVRALDADGASLAAGGPVVVSADPDSADNSLTLALSPAVAAERIEATAISIGGE